jgi:hypothetical protein
MLTQNTFSVVHKDDFILNQVELTTFTPWNDILIKLKSFSFLFFNIHGQRLSSIIKGGTKLSGDFILT